MAIARFGARVMVVSVVVCVVAAAGMKALGTKIQNNEVVLLGQRSIWLTDFDRQLQVNITPDNAEFENDYLAINEFHWSHDGRKALLLIRINYEPNVEQILFLFDFSDWSLRRLPVETSYITNGASS